MSRFKFRLNTLLRLREMARDERRGQLAQAYQADDILRRQEEEVSRELGSLARICRRASGPGPVDIDSLLAAQRYEAVLRFQATQNTRQRKMVAEEIDRRRQALVEADRQVRVMEKLREKQLRRHQEGENRREVKRLDEVAGQAAAREAVE